MESEQATRPTRGIGPRPEAAGWTVTPFDPAPSKAIPLPDVGAEWMNVFTTRDSFLM